MKELWKYGATKFKGLKGVDPSTTEAWLESMNRILQQLECFLHECVTCVISLMKKDAYQLWLKITQHVLVGQINWDFFQFEFQKIYVSELYLEDREQEFMMLRQGKMFVVDYEHEFLRPNFGDLVDERGKL